MKYPKIIYISDVPIEYSSAGGLFMYRLLEDYPSDKLLIVQTRPSLNELKLKNVEYHVLDRNFVDRIRYSRFHKVSVLLDIATNLFIPNLIKRVINQFQPQAVVTVTHRLGWMMAQKVSKKYRLPLHLILHDDFLNSNYGESWFKRYLGRKFKYTYLAAKSRLCISPYMEEFYQNEYKVKGQVLFPLQGKFDRRIEIRELQETQKNLNFCYAGSLHTGDFLPMLNMFAKILLELNHRLTIFATIDEPLFNSFDYLKLSHVSLKPFSDREEVNKNLFENSNVNIILSSFQHEHLFRLNFPSKLADYTLVPVPILIWGHPSSGVVRWANEIGYEGVLLTQGENSIREIILKLEVMKFRSELLNVVFKASIESFSYAKNFESFLKSLQGD